MEFSKNLSTYISDWFERQQFPTYPEGLYQPIAYALSSGGKRLRPTLLLAADMAFGGEPEKVRNQCLGIEMFHNFTLVHDDVMDKADVRRGRPTVHHKWSGNTAILSGDAMLTMATELIADCDDNKLRKVLDAFNHTAMEVYEGQQLDMEFEDRDDVSVDEYIEMIRLKTSVLLACALRIGAIMAGASSENADKLYEYGINLGLGFQLRDDYLDTFGDPLIFGKQIGGDILNDKKTWLMITACTEDESATMTSALRGTYSDEEKVERVTATYRKLNLEQRILTLIDDYSQKAIDIVNSVEMSAAARDYFTGLALEMARRVN